MTDDDRGDAPADRHDDHRARRHGQDGGQPAPGGDRPHEGGGGPRHADDRPPQGGGRSPEQTPQPRGGSRKPRGTRSAQGGGQPPQGRADDDRRKILALLGAGVVGISGYGLLSSSDRPPVGTGTTVDDPVQAAVSVDVAGSEVRTTYTTQGNADRLAVEVDCGDDGTVDGTGTLENVGETHSHDCSGADAARVTVRGFADDRSAVIEDRTVTL